MIAILKMPLEPSTTIYLFDHQLGAFARLVCANLRVRNKRLGRPARDHRMLLTTHSIDECAEKKIAALQNYMTHAR